MRNNTPNDKNGARKEEFFEKNHLQSNRYLSTKYNRLSKILSKTPYLVLQSSIFIIHLHQINNLIIMKAENTKAQMRKGFLEMVTLLIISKEEAYPSDIIKKLKENEMIVVEGTMYPMLTRLKNAGFLSYTWRESNSGPPRKYYALTEEGNMFLNELIATWNNLKRTVESISKTNS